MVTLLSCDASAVAVQFHLHHAWLLLRNRLMEPDVYNEVLDETQMKEWLMSEDSKQLRTLPPKSFCSAEVLRSILRYVESYVSPDGVYQEIAADGNWNFPDDTLRVGAHCCKLLEAAHYLDVEIWPASVVMTRNREGFPTHDRTFYNEVCKKLANLIVNAKSIQEIRDFCGVTHAGFDHAEIVQNLQVLHGIQGAVAIPDTVAGAMVIPNTTVAGGGESDGEAFLSLRTNHLPAVCVSIGKTATAQKIHCMYRLICVSRDFKDQLCGEFDPSIRDVVVNGPIQNPTSTNGSNAPLREVLQTLSKMAWAEKEAKVTALWRMSLIWTRTPYNTDQKCMERFVNFNGEEPFCQFFALRSFQMSLVDYQELVRGAGRDASEILTRIDFIAHQWAKQIDDVTFLQNIRLNSVQLESLCLQYRHFREDCENITDLMHDFHLLNNPSVFWQDKVSLARLSYLCEQVGVAVHKGSKKQVHNVQQHQLFTAANGWYLRVQVTQHETWEEEAKAEVLPRYEKDKIVYVVDGEIPIIKMTIRNIKRTKQSCRKKSLGIAMEDDVECNRQLVMRHTISADENEYAETVLNGNCPETDTKITKEVVLFFRTTSEQEMTCNIDDKETENAVLRIVLRAE